MRSDTVNKNAIVWLIISLIWLLGITPLDFLNEGAKAAFNAACAGFFAFVLSVKFYTD